MVIARNVQEFAFEAYYEALEASLSTDDEIEDTKEILEIHRSARRL